ncbi:MAG: 30S ribosomal protein S3 [Candidatus Omnitrophica bacterium]|nr:30S ribosomal protein S3 [Candidatus Omnitrophota bacterium]
MGQKSHPYGLRLGYIKDWKARWFARKDYSRLLHEDLKIRKYLKTKLRMAGVADIVIERSTGKLRIWIYTARPGLIIGRGGQEINRVRDELSDLTKSEVYLDIKEVEVPQTNAQLAAENVALQLEKRVAFRKAMKKALSAAMSKGAGGIKIMCKGRLGGTEIARAEGYKEGKVPLNTFRADVTYGFAEAFTTYGTIGVKVWIYHGDVLVKKEEAERAKEVAQMRPPQADQGEKQAREVAVVSPGDRPEIREAESAKDKSSGEEV